LGGNYYPGPAHWDNYLDRVNILGWEISADDFVVPVGHDDQRWAKREIDCETTGFMW
jgi:hypothetical protein